MSVSLTLTNIIEVVKNNYIFNALCSFEISAIASVNEMEVKRVKKKMCMEMIPVTQCEDPTGFIALRLSVDTLSYSI